MSLLSVYSTLYRSDFFFFFDNEVSSGYPLGSVKPTRPDLKSIKFN